MNSDIRISVSLPTNHKIKRLMMKHGAEAFYSLICLWTYAAQRSHNGRLTNMDDVDISLASNWNGDNYSEFIETLVSLRLLDKDGDEYCIHDWMENNPYAAGAGQRSDKARFSRLARENSVAFKLLKEKGISSISSTDYSDILDGKFNDVYERITNEELPSTIRTTPSPSPSPSPSPNVKDITPPKKEKSNGKQKENKTDNIRPDFVPVELWGPLLENRKFKKLQNTELALKTFCNSLLPAIEAGFPVEDCIGAFVASRWTSFKAEWMQNTSSQRVIQKNDCNRCDLKARGLCREESKSCDKFREVGR